MNPVAVPLSRMDIRRFAYSIRCSIKLADEPYFPIIPVLEFVIPKLYPGCTIEICSEEELGKFHGLTTPADNTIKIREDVYDGACKGKGRDRFTVAHEVGHFLLHTPSNISFARISDGEIPTYCNPEWQASTFAGELLIPAHLMRDKSVEQIAKLCGVTAAAAKVQRNKM